MEEREKFVEQIRQEAQALKESEPEKSEELDRKVMKIQQSFFAVQAPLQEKRKELDRKKRGKQFLRDVEEELLWINEKLPLAHDPNYGETLNEVQLKQKKFRVCPLASLSRFLHDEFNQWVD